MIENFEKLSVLEKEGTYDLKKTGNKARFLVEMKREGFNIPDGFILDTDLYREIVSKCQIKTPITAESFDGIEIPGDILESIFFHSDENKLYAVRSSASKEDMAGNSFAGQYNTFLNVKQSEIPGKILECYKSLFSDNIRAYLKDNGISADDLAMSVVVQEMVPSEISGVCFTINPVSGNDKEMLIEAAKGLGEDFVSGKSSPSTYRYNWFERKYTEKDNSGLIPDAMLDEMTRTFASIQQYFGYPCDIEFAIAGGKLYILQSRAVTSIKYKDYEDMWSTADFKDGGVSASVCTPYMWSLYEYIWEYTLRKFIVDSKILKDSEMKHKLGEMYFGRCYWNMTTVKEGMSRVVGYKEREFDSEYGIKRNYEGDGKTTGVTLKSLLAIARMAIAQNKILKERDENAQALNDKLLENYNFYRENIEKYKTASTEDIKSIWYKITHDDYLFSESTYFWQIFINTIHQSIYKDGLLKYVSEADYLTMLGSIENISHLLPFYEMWEVSRAIRNGNKRLDYWKNTSVENIVSDYSIPENKVFFEGVYQVVEKYGYHSDKELDVTYPCYYEDVTTIISSIKNMVTLDDSFSPEEDRKKGREKYEAIMNGIKEKVSDSKYKKIEKKVLKMRNMLWWREEFRDLSTRFYYIIRIYTVILADAFVRDGIISSEDDIWFLKVGDIWEYVEGKADKNVLLSKIERNRFYYNAYRNYISDNEIGSFMDGATSATAGGEQAITGLGACNGVVTGTARVIESFDEIDRLQEGDILVTRFTDTGWTGKFAILSGIVTEYGGILCHAAIVSREYGIPAIVNCKDVMKKIKDGDTITIDGTTGTITIGRLQ